MKLSRNASIRRSVTTLFKASLVLLVSVGGCDVGSSKIEATPNDWQTLDGHTVTVRGTAGNSELGPIVRFRDGGYIALKTRKPWSIDLLARPVDVKGQIVSGAGFRAEKFVLDSESIMLVPPPPTPPVKQQ